MSTYIRWQGRVEDENPDAIEDFEGWARWQGTSFAAPKVSAAIAPGGRRASGVDAGRGIRQADRRCRPTIPIRDVSSDLYPGGYTLPEVCVY